MYLPAGTDWYNFWTGERLHGGQTLTANAPIDVLPLFVRAGSILPLGTTVESTNEDQKIASIRVYPGADGDFELYRDDGKTYAYEGGAFQLTHIHWSDTDGKLATTGAPLEYGSTPNPVQVVGTDPVR